MIDFALIIKDSLIFVKELFQGRECKELEILGFISNIHNENSSAYDIISRETKKCESDYEDEKMKQFIVPREIQLMIYDDTDNSDLDNYLKWHSKNPLDAEILKSKNTVDLLENIPDTPDTSDGILIYTILQPPMSSDSDETGLSPIELEIMEKNQFTPIEAKLWVKMGKLLDEIIEKYPNYHIVIISTGTGSDTGEETIVHRNKDLLFYHFRYGFGDPEKGLPDIIFNTRENRDTRNKLGNKLIEIWEEIKKKREK